ncbi:hypothetical protein [Brevundimonas goettingensis]|uniref:Uncharacterized protein n=1 Tax=Brevundimonas goettingensis TaxID=2774190 RepID=A0A975GWF1_9CAUL|nr:hypothetical protein [Brevundimonas goettingensis]QTC91763.1 hypothetical protein IFJ75_02175 [Brevundimonas goettingensis]
MYVVSQITAAIGLVLLLTAGATFVVMSVRSARRFPAQPVLQVRGAWVMFACLVAGSLLMSASNWLKPG